MKLGILVVYMVEDEQAELLDLHLKRIARHTTVPWMIYGSVNRLTERYRLRLEHEPNVRLHELEPTALRGSAEHSHYLEQLVRIAIDDGATHVVTMHLDSFPVRDRWVETLVATLSGMRVFATIEHISTACLLFDRAFWLAHCPTFLPSEEAKQDAKYETYVSERAPAFHSGIGYGFAAWKSGLCWHELRESSRGDVPAGAAIYDDLVFHLKGAVRLSSGGVGGGIPGPIRLIGPAVLERALGIGRAVIPDRVRQLIRKSFDRRLESAVNRSRVVWQAEAMARASERLRIDPDAYIEELRGK